jgi:hypothetical protein
LQRRWRRWTILGAVVTVAAGLGAYAYLDLTSSRDLLDAIADADRLDPDRRFEDIEAARPKVPDGENSALLVAAAYAKIPKAFLASPPDGAPTILERLTEWPAEQQLDDAHLIELRAELAKRRSSATRPTTAPGHPPIFIGRRLSLRGTLEPPARAPFNALPAASPS